MFHVKHSRRARRSLLVLAGLALALVAVGCVRIAEPDGWPAPAVTADGLIVTQVRAGEVIAFDPSTGREVWHYPSHLPAAVAEDRPEMDNIYATPVVDGNTIYLASYDGLVTRIDSDEGRIESPWFTSLGEQVVATPILRDGALYVGTEGGHVAVIDVESGDLERRHRASAGRIWGQPVLENSSIYLADLDERRTVALDVDSGERLWEQGLTASAAADLVLDGDLLLVGSFDRALHALDVTAGGDERWRFRGDGWFVGPPLVHDGMLYAASMRGSVYAIDGDGNEVWRYELEGEEFRASPLLVDGTLVVAARGGILAGINLQTGAEQWRREVENAKINAHGLLVESDIFYITTDHELLQVDAATGAVQRHSIAR